MRKLAFFVVGGAIWLLVGAMPAAADNGPHMSTAGVVTDRCAGCHRVHSAKAAYILVEEEPALCYTCHGNDAGGSALAVTEGAGYSGSDRTGSPGALYGGGFEYALINTHQSGLTYGGSGGRLSNIATLAAANHESVTSTHSVDESAQTAWGAGGAFNGSLGTSVNLTCTNCHDPHGGADGGGATYRILSENPAGLAVSGSTAATNALAVSCTPGDFGDANACTATAGANTVTCSATWSTSSGGRIRVACNSTLYPATLNQVTGVANSPANIPAGTPPNIEAVTDVGTKTYTTTDYFANRTQVADYNEIANWCSQCHTRYKAVSGQTYAYNTGDPVFTYRHQAASSSANCVTCHVAHGANSATGDIGSRLENPSGTVGGVPVGGGTAGLGVPAHGTVAAKPASADNRLLRVDMRGICAGCHVK